MIIQNAKGLFNHLLIIEELTKEIKAKKPSISDEDAFNLAKCAIELMARSKGQ